MRARFQMFPYFFCLLDGPWLGSDGQSQSIGIFPLQFFFVRYILLVKVYTIKIKTLDFFRRPRILFAN